MRKVLTGIMQAVGSGRSRGAQTSTAANPPSDDFPVCHNTNPQDVSASDPSKVTGGSSRPGSGPQEQAPLRVPEVAPSSVSIREGIAPKVASGTAPLNASTGAPSSATGQAPSGAPGATPPDASIRAPSSATGQAPSTGARVALPDVLTGPGTDRILIPDIVGGARISELVLLAATSVYGGGDPRGCLGFSLDV